jgi:hypothetical protein
MHTAQIWEKVKRLSDDTNDVGVWCVSEQEKEEEEMMKEEEDT